MDLRDAFLSFCPGPSDRISGRRMVYLLKSLGIQILRKDLQVLEAGKI